MSTLKNMCFQNNMRAETTPGEFAITGFIRVREMSGNFKLFQGQGIVREFYVVSGKMKVC